LVNDVYKELENKTLNEIINGGNMPINYFINKSFENMQQLIDYNFVEITTNNNIVIGKKDTIPNSLFINPFKSYVCNFKEKSNIKNVNIIKSNKEGHNEYNKEKDKIIPCYKLLYMNKVRNIEYLKIDTKINDSVILKSLFSYLNHLPSIFYPKQIILEDKDNKNKNDIKKIINLFNSLGYKFQSEDFQLILIYKNN
jgi:hypothetical protein